MIASKIIISRSPYWIFTNSLNQANLAKFKASWSSQELNFRSWSVMIIINSIMCRLSLMRYGFLLLT